MKNVWVYDYDGTVQCDDTFVAIPLETMAAKLSEVVGKENIVSQKKSTRIMMSMCLMPTGAINAYELTPEGWILLSTGIMGMIGFKRLEIERHRLNEEPHIGQFLDSVMSSRPQFIRELPGCEVRIYQDGDALTKDFRPSRCNIETSGPHTGTIKSVWFG